MISRRLTKLQKHEIVEAYRRGERTNSLAEKYSCSSNTINRTVKALLTDSEYKLLKGKRIKTDDKKLDEATKKVFTNKKDDFEEQKSLGSSLAKVNEHEKSIKTDNDIYNPDFEEIALIPYQEKPSSDLEDNDNSDIEKINLSPDNKLEEIVPLITSFDFDKNEVDLKLLNQENLPEIVYMLVDKKVELESYSIADLPEWSFLPDHELKRNAILLFSNQRSAKRGCTRNQRVIKIPNTNIFEVTKSYLVAKGITRLILEDSIIALDD